MSQEKVERKKELKANRKSINAQKRMKNTLAGIITAAICIVIVGWIGFSVYTKANAPEDGVSAKVPVDITSVMDFLNEVQIGE